MINNFNYNKEYNDFWSRDERWGTDSFEDVNSIVNEIIKTCGTGSILDVGCGMGAVVKEFCKRGIEAYGVDVASKPIEYNNKEVPDHFFNNSILELPFKDNNFNTVITTDCLEHIRTEDIDKAIKELFRVTKRNFYVRLSMREDCDSRWHLTIKDREWWEKRFLDAGFKKHPLYAEISGFGDTSYTESQFVALYIKDKKLEDMKYKILKTFGVKSDIFMIKSLTMIEYIQNGDNIGIFSKNDYVYKYIIENTCKVNSIKCIKNLSKINGNIDFLLIDGSEVKNNIDFDTLIPGCRVLFNFDNKLYLDRDIFINKGLFIERVWRLNDFNSKYWKVLKEFLLIENNNENIKIDMVLGMKDPLGKGYEYYEETAWGTYGINHHFVDFKNNYINPYIWKVVLSSPHRDVKTNIEFCQRILNTYPKDSADYGGAICYLSYRILDLKDKWNIESIKEHISLAKQYLDIQSDNTHVYRWKISLSYVIAQLYLKIGDKIKAKEYLLKCTEYNPNVFSPTIATKMMLSYEQLCLIDCDNNKLYWEKALSLLEKLFKNINWTDVYGDKNIPVPFGFSEMGEIFKIITRIAWRIYYKGKVYPIYLKNHADNSRDIKDFNLRNKCIELERALLEKEEAKVKLEQMLSEAVQEKERQINEYEKSLSWKITSPLRKIKNLFR